MKKTYTGELKAMVALEILKGEKTLSEICSEHSIHPTQGGKWRDRLVTGAKDLFGKKENERIKVLEEENEQLSSTLGRKEMELRYLKKKLNLFQ